jgi:hypothetical protein
MDLGDCVNTRHWRAGVSLVNLVQVYPELATATFFAQVREYPGAGTVKYEWKTGGSVGFPNSTVFYDPTTKILVWDAPSTDLLAAFPTGGQFYWEPGFYLPSAPTDFIGLGTGPASFPVINGVVR